MGFNNLTKDQLNEAYTYYIKVLLQKVHEFYNNPAVNKTQTKVEIRKIFTQLNRIRKIQNKPSINTSSIIYVGRASYLKFF